MRLKIFFGLCILFGPYLSKAQTVFDTSPTGLKYKIFTHEKGLKAIIGDYIKFNFTLYSAKDSVLASTFKSIIPVTTTVREPTYPGDLEEAFMMLAPGDSGAFMVSADSFYNGRDMPVASGAMLKIVIKMLSVESPQQHEKEREKEKARFMKVFAARDSEAQTNLDAYIKKNDPNAKKTADGLYYIIKKQGTGPYPKDGQTLVIRYNGTLLDGNTVAGDSGKTVSFVMGRQQVMAGLEKGFALLKKGGKARFFIPPALAYRERSNGRLIPPFSTLIYDVELVGIK